MNGLQPVSASPSRAVSQTRHPLVYAPVQILLLYFKACNHLRYYMLCPNRGSAALCPAIPKVSNGEVEAICPLQPLLVIYRISDHVGQGDDLYLRSMRLLITLGDHLGVMRYGGQYPWL